MRGWARGSCRWGLTCGRTIRHSGTSAVRPTFWRFTAATWRPAPDAIFTNTFGANRFWLNRFGQGDAIESINRRAAGLAREAAGPGRFVIGDIGPTAARRQGSRSSRRQVLVDAGVDALILETYSFPDVGASAPRGQRIADSSDSVAGQSMAMAR